MTVGSRIREFRKRLGLSVDDVAERLKKNRATIYRYESDDIENLPAPILEPLAKVLQTTPAELMGWEQSPTPTSDNLPTLTQRDSTAHSRRDMNDLAKFLNKTEVMFDGNTYSLSEEDQQKLRNALEFVFWDAKRQNKRKKD